MADMENVETIVQPTPAAPTEDTWNKSEGVGGAIDEGKGESSLESPTNSEEAIIDNTIKAVEGLGVDIVNDDKDKDKETKEEDKSGEPAGEPDKKVEPEPDKKDEALEKALAKIADIESQMADMANEQENNRVEEQRRRDRETSEEDKAVRDALLNTPDDELTENELKMKKYLTSQDARMDKLERSLGEQSKSRTVEAYQKRFDGIRETHNKDGDVWLNDNDIQTVAIIAQRHDTDDIEGIAQAMVEDKKANFNSKLEKQKQKIISDYIDKKKNDKDTTPVIEKGGDAPPPDKTEKLSMDKPGALKKSFIRDFLSNQGKKA